MRGRNTENLIIKLDHGMSNYQQKRYVLMNFFHREKHIIFSDVGKGRRRMEVLEGVRVVVAMIV